MSRFRRPRFQPPSRPPGPPLPTGGHRAPLVPGASGPAPTEPQPRVPHLAAPPLGAQHTPPAALTPLPARGGCSPGTHPHPTAAPAPPSQLHGPQLSGRETDHPLLLLGGGGRELRRPPRWRLTTNSAPPGGGSATPPRPQPRSVPHASLGQEPDRPHPRAQGLQTAASPSAALSGGRTTNAAALRPHDPAGHQPASHRPPLQTLRRSRGEGRTAGAFHSPTPGPPPGRR